MPEVFKLSKDVVKHFNKFTSFYFMKVSKRCYWPISSDLIYSSLTVEQFSTLDEQEASQKGRKIQLTKRWLKGLTSFVAN